MNVMHIEEFWQMFLEMILWLIVILKYICIYDMFFWMKKRKTWKTVLLAIGGCILVLWFIETNVINPLIPYTVFVIYETIVIYENCNGKVLLTGVWSTCVIGLLDEMGRIMAEKLLQYMNIDNAMVLSYMAHSMTLLFLFLLSMLIKRKSRGKIEKISITYYIFSLVLTFANTCIIAFFMEFVFQQIETKNKTLVYVTFLGTTVGMFIEIVMVMMLAVSRNAYKEKNELNQKFLEEQKNHYRYLEERENETKHFRHDMRSHMNYITEAWHKKKYDEAGKYIEELYGRFEEFGNTITVHNGIVDAILNKYDSDAKKVKVSMEVRGHLPDECNIEAFDLCTIFSNLLANAVEAAAKSAEKRVKVECGYNENKILLSFINDYNGRVDVRDGNYITSKENSAYHGYGLTNVKRSVNNYSGYMDIKAEERFVVNISLNNKLKQKPVIKEF